MTNQTLPPAVACPLFGTHLIEASAGTGKTWTLTGILLRLLIEKRTPPEKIVATTFTRAAAQEMQERLHDRLQAFYRLCLWLKQALMETDLYRCSSADKLAFFANHFDQQPELSDPIHQHLLFGILSAHPHELDKTVRQLSLLMLSVDKLFIGTLDSLAQKWLTEFGAELGLPIKATVTPDVRAICEEVVHDELRRLHSQMYHNAPKLYRLLFVKDDNDPTTKLSLSLFSDVNGVLNWIDNSLQFLTAEVDEFLHFGDLGQVSDAVIADWEKTLQGLVAKERFEPFKRYCDKEFLGKTFGMGMQTNFAKQFHTLPSILKKLQDNGLAGILAFDKDERAFLESLPKYLYAPTFKKGFEHNLQEWQALPLDALRALHQFYEKYVHQTGALFKSAMAYHFAQHTRHTLNQKLEFDKKTTFAKQMADLAQALAGRQGGQVARHIRHLYPVALIDEVQDINGEQMALLANVYLNEPAKKDIFHPEKQKGFFLCVGDPKQAIYRFRGGDVANYNALKRLGLSSEFSLDTNRRSSRSLIEWLNRWFADDARTLGQDIAYQTVQSARNEHFLSWQVSLNTADDNEKLGFLADDLTDDLANGGRAFLPATPVALLQFSYDTQMGVMCDKVAQHINSVLQTAKIYDKGERRVRAVLPSDIAVLAKTHDTLSAIKGALAGYGIDSVSAKLPYLFATPACKALYSLLLAVADDRDEHLGAMLGGLFLLPMGTIEWVLADDRQKLRLIGYLQNIKKRWIAYGIGSALAWAFFAWRFAKWRYYPNMNDLPKDLPQSLWEYLATFADSERFLTDLWQLWGVLSDDVFGAMTAPNEVLAKLTFLMDNPHSDEAYQAIALPSQSAVQLLTVHRSKGLEYPIVYVLGLDSGHSDPKMPVLLPYVTPDGHRRLSAVANAGEQDFLGQNAQELFFEDARLGYVALTRASEQVFVVAKDKKPPSEKSKAQKTSVSVLQAWGFYDESNALIVPERLAKMALLAMDDLTLLDKPYRGAGETLVPIVYPAWHSIFKTTHFAGQHRTSFTGLYHLLDKTALGQVQPLPTSPNDVFVPLPSDPSPDVADYLVLEEDAPTAFLSPMTDDDANAIRANFVRGKEAGVFLHKALELIHTNDRVVVSRLVEHLALTHKLSSEYQKNATAPQNRHEPLVSWLLDIANTPLASGVSLLALPAKKRKSEFGFMLGAKTAWQAQAVYEAFVKYSDKPLPPFADNRRWFDFLSGEMDLLYEHQGKYYVVDYKSNFLATHWQQYDTATMEKAMTDHGYWLQAVLYQVALHRLLKLRIADYVGNESKYLGAVEYVFLRGVAPHSAQNTPILTGSLRWQVPFALVAELDRIL